MEKLLLTVWEAADALSISRSRVYELLYAEQPVWSGAGYCDPDTGVMLPTWRQALDQLDADPDVGPVHVMRFGTQHDIAGIIAPSADADRAVRYLAKYLTKAIGDPLGENSESDPAREAHIDRLLAELRWLPCSRRCANWLCYGIQPDRPSPGRCPSNAHDREHLCIGGRRVLVSRDWSGKTLSEHRADRSAVVREALQSRRHGRARPRTDGHRRPQPRRAPPLRVDRRTPRPHHLHPDAPTRSRRTTTLARQYDQAKTRTAVETVDSLSAIGPPSGGGPPSPSVAHSSASPDNPPNPGPQDRQSRVSAANPQDRSEATALDGRAGGPTFHNSGEAEPLDPEPSQCRPPEDRRRS
jgi:Replication initiator protein, pSAM2